MTFDHNRKTFMRKTLIDEPVVTRISYKGGEMRTTEILKTVILLTLLGEGSAQSELD